jgi:predicted transcriptional regulator
MIVQKRKLSYLPSFCFSVLALKLVLVSVVWKFSSENNWAKAQAELPSLFLFLCTRSQTRSLISTQFEHHRFLVEVSEDKHHGRGEETKQYQSLYFDQIMQINRYFAEKEQEMDSTHIRKRIHEYVDQADDRFLTLVNGMIEADKEQDWWDDLHPNLKASIDRALAQSERGEGRPHEEVMAEIRAKYQQ